MVTIQSHAIHNIQLTTKPHGWCNGRLWVLDWFGSNQRLKEPVQRLVGWESGIVC